MTRYETRNFRLSEDACGFRLESKKTGHYRFFDTEEDRDTWSRNMAALERQEAERTFPPGDTMADVFDLLCLEYVRFLLLETGENGR